MKKLSNKLVGMMRDYCCHSFWINKKHDQGKHGRFSAKLPALTLAAIIMLTGGFASNAWANDPYNSSVVRVYVTNQGFLRVEHQGEGRVYEQNLTDIFGGSVDTNNKYVVTNDPGDNRSTVYTITEYDKDDVATGKTYTITDTNTTLVPNNNALSIDDNGTITMTAEDTSGNKVTGTASIQPFADKEIENKAKDGKMELDGQDTTIEGAINTVNQEAKKHTTVGAGTNIVVTEEENTDGGKHYTVATKDEVEFTKVTTTNLSATDIKTTNLEATDIKTDRILVGNTVEVSDSGIDAGGTKIVNVADGTAPSDAATFGQLTKMGNSLKQGIAGAGALAALHPMDFDPDSKVQFAAGYGNYHDKHAMAIGLFYRPDESMMFNVGGSFGGGENIVNAGVTFALDGGKNRITRSRTAMAKEIVELRSLVTQLAARMDRVRGAESTSPAEMFPDVPENHWAYAYIKDLHDKGIIEGYPDGNFNGDRSMSRYEFAAMLDRALQKGVKLSSAIVKEFKPELGRIYVERISGKDNDRHKIERVRVANHDEENRDVYGSRIVTSAVNE